jgi:hypothetical protein
MDLGEATTFPFIIFYVINHKGYTQMSFCPESPLASAWVHYLTLFHILENANVTFMLHSWLAPLFPFLCLGHEPKARVVTLSYSQPIKVLLNFSIIEYKSIYFLTNFKLCQSIMETLPCPFFIANHFFSNWPNLVPITNNVKIKGDSNLVP